MGDDRRTRRQERAREFGRRHPRPTLVIVCAALAGLIAVCAFQLSHGAYLGRGWVIAALAGMAAAAGLSAATLISSRRHGTAAGRFKVAWLVLGLLSASAIRYPFPLGSYGSVQAFFNVVHAALLGFEAVTCTAIVALLAYRLIRPRGLPGRAVPQPPPVRAAGRRGPGHAPDGGGLPARLRFPNAKSATWRAGRLIVANGTVTWLSLNSNAEVDLTSACQALPMLPADTRERQPRTTTLATANGVVEVDVSPRALETLVSSLRRPHIR